MINTYYDESSNLWIAYFSDSIGQLGKAEIAQKKDVAVFNLGMKRGQHPERYSRDIGEYMPAYEKELCSK